jgi:hypothetical protein
MIRINTDVSWGHLAPLVDKRKNGFAGALPRQTKYGYEPGMIPMGDYPDLIIPEDSIKEVIERGHAEKRFPIYHQKNSWAPDGFHWYQNGLNYCWSWSLAADMMDLEAVEGKRDASTPRLASVTMGRIVNWRNKGDYLEDGIRGLIKYGFASETYVPDPHSLNYREYEDGWEDDALLHRIPEDSVWDMDPKYMLRHILTGLDKGRSAYGGWNELGHAMSVVGMLWDKSAYNNVIIQVRNSHNETEPIEMVGRNALPDEAYIIHATLNV